MKKGRTSQLNEHRIQLLNDLGFAWEVQRGGRRRQLAPAGSEAAKEVTSPTEKLCILPGKALIGGKDGMLMSVTDSKTKPPSSKKFKSAAANEETTEDEHISAQDRQQQMLQQQRFAGVVPGMPGMWQNPAAFAGMDPQQAFFGAHAMNFAAGPYWGNMGPMSGMGPFPSGFFPPFPYGAAAQGGMMHNPMNQQSLEMMIANSNTQSRSNNRSDPPSGENPMMAMPGVYPFFGQFGGQQVMQQSQSGTENRNVTNNSKRSARAGDPPADPPTSGNSNSRGNKNSNSSTTNGKNGPHSANQLNQSVDHGADDSAAGTHDPLVCLGMSNEMNPNESEPLPLNHKRAREMNGRHFEDTEDDDSF